VEEVERFRGCILGLAIGDALGHPTEFVGSVAAIRARWGEAGVVDFHPSGRHPAGTFTDDTQMTIGVLRALVRAGHADLERLMDVMGQEFVAWSRSPENNRAPGGTCLAGCRSLAHGTPWRQAGVRDSKGCGAAMRAAPIGLFFAGEDQVDRLVRVAAAQSSLTHRHPTGIASSVAAAAPVAFAVREGTTTGMLAFTRACVERLDAALLVEVGCAPELAESIGNREMLDALDAVEREADTESEDVCKLLGGAWIGEEAVATALWCVLRAKGTFKDSVLRGANSSGDSDSIACIAGSITGALVGRQGLDAGWAERVEKSAMLDGLATALHRVRHGADEPETAPELDPFDAEPRGARDIERDEDEQPAHRTKSMSKTKPEPETVAELEAQIRHHNKLYWDANKPEISDYAYDALVTKLKAMAPDSPVLTEMGPTPGERLGAEFRHKERMLSLDKCYAPEDLASWAASFEGGVVATPKYDGIACSLHYDKKGKLAVAATRGDGVVGDDITVNALEIKDIPARIESDGHALEVRGEIYMRLSVFEKFKAEGMANPRNLTAGAIKQKDKTRSAAYKLSFAAYDLIGAEDETQEQELKHLVTLGFPKIDYFLLAQKDVLKGYEEFARLRPTLDYEIDGVVFKANLIKEQRRLGQTAHHPRHSLAYKFQGDSGLSTLEAVEWSVARTGAITPVAIVSPVALSGVTVTRASLHNVAFIGKLGLTIGAKVTLVRRGGVIPNVEGVVEPGTAPVAIPEVCPSCGSKVVREKDFLYCTTPRTCRRAVIGQLSHYAATCDMMGFGDSILEQCYDTGLLRSPADFYRLKAEDLAKLERSGDKIANKLVAEVAKKRTLEVPTFLRALGIAELGKHVSAILADRYHTLDAILAVTEADLAGTHGIGDTIARSVVTGLEEARPEIEALRKHVTVAEAKAETGGAGRPLSGKSFVFTGKLQTLSRSEAEQRVRALGAAVLSSVSKALSYLVVGQEKDGGKSTKQKAAEKLVSQGEPLVVLTEPELFALLDKLAAADGAASAAKASQAVAEPDDASEEAAAEEAAAIVETPRKKPQKSQGELF
jgi:DNA ligase (NAD+)